MWERFSYYGMRALLVLFLTSYLGFEDKNAYIVYSLFAAIGYAFPIFGGFLADRVMGFRNMVLIGGIIIALGHAAMTLSTNSSHMMYWGLGLIGVGTGLFKGNITNLLGSCYVEGDKKRSQGFTLFYVGVNLGSFMASIACAYIAKLYGWDYGFGLAGIGMIFGLILFIKFQFVLNDVGSTPRPDLMNKKFLGLTPFWLILIGGILISILCAKALQHAEIFTNILKYFGVIILGVYIYIIYKSDQATRLNLYAIAIMIIVLMIFFALEMQLGSLINLFTERNVGKNLFGFMVPAAASQAINPIAIIIIGVISSILIPSNKSFDTLKIFLSILAMAACFLVLYVGCSNARIDGQINYLYLISGISLMSLGELLIAPIIQSYVSLLAPNNLKGLIMGIMMLALAFSNLAGIIIAEFMSVPSIGGEIDVLTSLEIYKAGFHKIVIFHIYVAIGFIPLGIYLHKILKKNMS